MGVLKSNSRILHTKSGVTIVYQIDDEVIASLKLLYDFIEQIIGEISKEISFTYEINTKFINGEKFCGIPWIKIHYKNKNFAYFGLSETKRLMIGKNIPENKQVASLELFETNDLEIYRNQIFQEFKKIVSELDKHQ